ncbi:uncharacterized protein G2W53_042490 [Senna tora]|uniref:Uncharacterized protein n=1 Tax=Senna tora TaxID=362788 RepID=A0A834SGX8_9FABA|nr:uncharacterized protein G2W53_042490 [Senna tora]
MATTKSTYFIVKGFAGTRRSIIFLLLGGTRVLQEGFSFRRAQPLTHLSRSTSSIGESPNRFLDSSFAGPLHHCKFLQSSASDR